MIVYTIVVVPVLISSNVPSGLTVKVKLLKYKWLSLIPSLVAVPVAKLRDVIYVPVASL